MRPVEEILERTKSVREKGCPNGVNHFLRCEIERDESRCRVRCEECGWECIVMPENSYARPEMKSPDISGYVMTPEPSDSHKHISGYIICRGNGEIHIATGEHLPVNSSGHPMKCSLLFFDRREAEQYAYGDAHVKEIIIQKVA